jgi:hypothetical protein
VSKRTLVLPNKDVWTYHVGRSCVRLVSPVGLSYVAFCSDVKGITETTWERGRYKQTSDGMLYPSEVAAFISRLTSQPETITLVNRRKDD